MPESWVVELHSHTYYSKDSLTRFETFIEAAKRHGIDKVAVTDHNTATAALAMAKRWPDMVIVGEEIMTTEGEILAFFLRETIPPYLSPGETIKRLRDQGAFISVSHPYDRLRKGAWREPALLAIIEQVDALEVFNSRCLYSEDNDKALALAARYNKLGTVGSDAHLPYELGRSTQRMQPFEGPGDFFEALKTAERQTKLSPAWVHGATTIAKWLRKTHVVPLPEKLAPKPKGLSNAE